MMICRAYIQYFFQSFWFLLFFLWKLFLFLLHCLASSSASSLQPWTVMATDWNHPHRYFKNILIHHTARWCFLCLHIPRLDRRENACVHQQWTEKASGIETLGVAVWGCCGMKMIMRMGRGCGCFVFIQYLTLWREIWFHFHGVAVIIELYLTFITFKFKKQPSH